MREYIVLGLCVVFLTVTIFGGSALSQERNGSYDTGRNASGYPEGSPMPLDDEAIEAPRGNFPAAKMTDSDEGDSVFYDVIILRPAGLIACVAGLAASIIALPFSLPSGSQDKVFKFLIVDPFEYTFKRPVGKIDP